MLKVAPISGSLMLFSMLGGIIVSVMWYFGSIPKSWAFAMIIAFVIMFISSIISTTYAPIEDEIEIEKRSGIDNLIKK